METTLFDYNKFKENPELFFSQLPQKAEEEFASLLEFLIFKYDLHRRNKNEDTKKKKFNLFSKKPILVKNIKKYTKEELHER